MLEISISLGGWGLGDRQWGCKMNKKYDSTFFWCFLIGLGLSTQVYIGGCIGISEIFMFLVAPVIFVKDLRQLRRDGFMPLVVLFVLCAIGSIISGIINKSSIAGIYKFLASLYSTFCAVVIFHRAVSRNPYSVGGFLLGFAISGIISIFAFNPKASLELGELDINVSVEEQMQGVLFWVFKIKRFIYIPISLFYYKMNIFLLALLPLAHSIFSLATSVSGRAAALVSVGATFLILWGRKSRRAMKQISRHFGLLCLLAVVILAAFKWTYGYTASHGYLGELARQKYNHQTSQGNSALKLLMSGRAEFFVGLKACLDKPIIGWGARPVDTEGYWYDFLRDYGDPQDFEYYVRSLKNDPVIFIPEHSHLVIYWLHCGICGLLFYLYVLRLIFKFFRDSIGAIPQLFGYFVLVIPSLLWDIFFTPLTSRVNTGVAIAAMLVARAITLRKAQLPLPYEFEAQKYD